MKSMHHQLIRLTLREDMAVRWTFFRPNSGSGLQNTGKYIHLDFIIITSLVYELCYIFYAVISILGYLCAFCERLRYFLSDK